MDLRHHGVRYVAECGDDSSDGVSWESPMRSVAAAVQSLPEAGGSRQRRHYGRVEIGDGLFDEVGPIEANQNISYVGRGLGTTDGEGTVIRSVADSHLFAPSSEFDDYAHNVVFKDLVLDGNKAEHPGPYDLVRLYRGGFGCAMYNVSFRNAPRYGLKLLDGAVNFVGYNLTGLRCEEAFFHLNLVWRANLTNIAFYGTQVDNCGAAPFLFRNEASGDANTVLISGLETEATVAGQHHTVIETDSEGANNPIWFTIENVVAFIAGVHAQDAVSVVHETSPVRSRYVLINVHGSGYPKAFQSENIAGYVSSTNHELLTEVA